MTRNPPAGRFEIDVVLRDVRDEDLDGFFDNQSDAISEHLAALPSRSRTDFDAHWKRIRSDPAVRVQTIVADGEAAGNVMTFERDGRREVGYWIDRRFWGRGIATRALAAFLETLTVRPLYGHVAKHNPASARVLEKCGFTRVGENAAFSIMKGRAIAGDIYELK